MNMDKNAPAWVNVNRGSNKYSKVFFRDTRGIRKAN